MRMLSPALLLALPLRLRLHFHHQRTRHDVIPGDKLLTHFKRATHSYTVLLKGKKRKVTETGKRKAMLTFFKTALRRDQPRPKLVEGKTLTLSGRPVKDT